MSEAAIVAIALASALAAATSSILQHHSARRAPDGRADDEGWVLCLLYDAARGASDLLILDATAFGGPPEAVVHLPRRVPFGFHGTWIPAR